MLQVDGTATIGSTANNTTTVTVNTAVLFSAAATSQITIAQTANFFNNTFALGAGATLATKNANGILGANCSIVSNGSRGIATIPNTVNYIFNGAANQATLGLNATLGSLTIANTGTAPTNIVSLNGAKTITGALTMTSGVLNLANNSITSAGNLQGAANITNNTAGNPTMSVGNDNSATTYSGVISNGTTPGTMTIALTKIGTGALTLSGLNSYTGATTISAGTIKLGQAGDGTNGPLGTTAGATSITSGAALDLNGFTLSTSEPLTLNGTGIAAGGALTNSSATAVSYNGLITLGSASSIVTNAGDINVANAGTITGATFGLTLGGSGNGSVSSIIGTTSGTVTKAGNGTWTLSGNSTYTGTTTISAGTLKLGAAGAGANSPLGTIANRTTVTAGAALDLNGFTLATAELLTINGTGISNGGALLNSSSTAVSYSGLLTLGAASSIVANAGDLNITNTGTIPGPTFGLTLGGSGNGSIASIIGTTSGSLTMNGAGVWTLSGANTYTGSTTINSGELRLNQSGSTTQNSQVVLNGGTLGTTNIASGASITKSSTLNLNSGLNKINLGSNPHSLSFANSSAIGWAGTSLTVYGWTGTAGQSNINGGKIFFGNSLNTLTPAQLAQISFDGFSTNAIILIGTGEIVPQPQTPLLIITGPASVGNSCVLVPGTPVQYTVTNNGTVAADGISIGSTDGQFTFTTPTSPIAPNGGFATFLVTFTPTAAGTPSTDITATSTTANSNTASITVGGTGLALPIATFTYAGSTFCQGLPSNPSPHPNQSPTITGLGGGTFSATPGGLVFVSTSTGEVDMLNSAPGAYTIKYTVTGANGCTNFATWPFTINALPAAPTIAYALPAYCGTDAGPISPSARTIPGGTAFFSIAASPSGLNIDATSGDIIPNLSTPGTYTVTITNTNGACNNTSTTTVIIGQTATGTISYGSSPYCTNGGTATVTNNVIGTQIGATYTEPTGLLSLDATTGAVNLALSTPGTYTVTYNVPAVGCVAYTTTATIVVNPAPTVTTISYPGASFCRSGLPVPVTISAGGQGGGVFSAPAALTIDPSTGDINPATSTAGGPYTITYTYSNGLCSASTTTSVTILALPTATISYAGSPFCTSTTTHNVTLTGTGGGTYSSTTGLTINTTTGQINSSTSTPGTYTVTYTFTGGGCTNTATANVTITALPVATFSYAGSPYCKNATNPSPTLNGGAGTFSAIPAGLVFVSTATGQINLAASTVGTYTVTNTIAAAGGCAQVTSTASVTILPIAGITSVTATPRSYFLRISKQPGSNCSGRTGSYYCKL